MRAPNACPVEEIAAKTAAQMDLAKLIRHFRNSLSAIRAEAVRLDEWSIPRVNFFLEYFNGIVDDFHLPLTINRDQVRFTMVSH